MKKLFSIFFAFLILLSGMHFSIATHFCGGKIAEVKWSFSEKKASCGMENSDQACSNHDGFASNCCHNKIAIYSIDDNYNPSSYQTLEIAKNLLKVFFIFKNISLYSIASSNCFYTYISPHDNLLTSAVSLANICVFRI
jgi:hypothetical protein